MKFYQITIGLIILIHSIEGANSDVQAKFQQWRTLHTKTYATADDEKKAFNTFVKNLNDIEAHNARYKSGNETFKRGLWKRSDLTFEEKQKFLAGDKEIVNATITNGILSPTRSFRRSQQNSRGSSTQAAQQNLPLELNWTSAGLVHPVDDQGRCGSCYAHATVGVTEGVLLKKNIKTRLSVQQIVDCNKANDGCNGGDIATALAYIKNKGLASVQNYPYTGKDGKCKSFQIAGKVSSMYALQNLNGNENRLKSIVAKYGPVAIAINAANSFMNYMSGVYNNPRCSKRPDHAVLLVGYGSDKTTGLDYWLVKNSWGVTWGESGYVKMVRNKGNQCGIANSVVYAT